MNTPKPQRMKKVGALVVQKETLVSLRANTGLRAGLYETTTASVGPAGQKHDCAIPVKLKVQE